MQPQRGSCGVGGGGGGGSHGGRTVNTGKTERGTKTMTGTNRNADPSPV